jgi:hypothetical protein
MVYNKDHTFPEICPQDFLERLWNLVSDGEQIETGILGCSDLMFYSSQVWMPKQLVNFGM